jgi:glycerol uptake facilitator-like aquaporin
LPAYGQVFLAETLGSIIYVLVCLQVKDDIKHRYLDPFFYPLSATICMIGIHFMFLEVSGGVFNPAIILA